MRMVGNVQIGSMFVANRLFLQFFFETSKSAESLGLLSSKLVAPGCSGLYDTFLKPHHFAER